MLLALSLVAAPLAAQSAGAPFIAIATGFGFQDTHGSELRNDGGAAARLTLGRYASPRFVYALTASAAWFEHPEIVSGPCPPQPGACDTGERDLGSVGVSSLTADVLLFGRTTPKPYVIAGAGAARLFDHPEREGAVRPLVHAGAGLAVPVGTVELLMDLRYERLFDLDRAPRWLFPVTLGIRF